MVCVLVGVLILIGLVLLWVTREGESATLTHSCDHVYYLLKNELHEVTGQKCSICGKVNSLEEVLNNQLRKYNV